MFTDSVDSLETCVDVGIQRGKQNRTRDIISWVKKRRRHIRREDLIAFLCGKNPPNRHRSKHSHNRTLERSHSPRVNNVEAIQQNSEPDLQAFREAIALQGKEFSTNVHVPNLMVLNVHYLFKECFYFFMRLYKITLFAARMGMISFNSNRLHVLFSCN